MSTAPNGRKWSLLTFSNPIKALVELGVIGFVCVLLLRSQDASEARSREDRQMYRAEMQTMHTDSQRKWEAITANQRAVLDMTVTIRGSGDVQQKAMAELTTALKTLTEETRKLKDETKKSVPPGLDHRQGGRDG